MAKLEFDVRFSFQARSRWFLLFLVDGRRKHFFFFLLTDMTDQLLREKKLFPLQKVPEELAKFFFLFFFLFAFLLLLLALSFEIYWQLSKQLFCFLFASSSSSALLITAMPDVASFIRSKSVDGNLHFFFFCDISKVHLTIRQKLCAALLSSTYFDVGCWTG